MVVLTQDFWIKWNKIAACNLLIIFEQVARYVSERYRGTFIPRKMSSKNEPQKIEDENMNPIVDPEDVFDPDKWPWSTGRESRSLEWNIRSPPLFFNIGRRNG